MTGRTDRASRVIAAAPGAIYDAFLDPETLMKWLPPGGMTGRVLEFEPREGGRYCIELTYTGEGKGKTGNRTDVTRGRFLTLEPGRRIVWSADFDSDDPSFAGTMIMNWLFEPHGQGCRVTIIAEDVPTGISQADHDAGLNASLTNLAEFFGGAEAVA